MAENITFDALSSTDFEELICDLLNSMCFSNINWRKGTGYENSPADQGRDIECTNFSKGPDGSIELEKWFVECKHHKRGVPPDALAGALTWAQGERPARLVFVISNFLSNPAKQYLETFKHKNQPAFKISVWELPKLRELLAVHTQILRKYGLLGEFPLLSVLHPSHIRYLKMPPPNTIKYFFGLLEELSSVDRKECLSKTMFDVVFPSFRKPPPDYKGTIGELMIDKVDYPIFKEKLFALAKIVVPYFLVSAIVSNTLQYLLQMGDQTSIGRVLENIDHSISTFRKKIANGDPQSESIYGCIDILEKKRETSLDDVKHYYNLYTTFCEKVVAPLFDECLDVQTAGLL